MCGIFGLIRNDAAAHPERASAAFVELGHLAVERGSDSAGFALAAGRNSGNTITRALTSDLNSRQAFIEGVHIVKDVVAFHELWNDADHLPLLGAHKVAIGHTRWATQGKRGDLTNASPLALGTLVGTHNGDVDTKTVDGHRYLPYPVGGTDTEVLYNALHRDRGDRRKIAKVLGKVEGRAALAWMDRTKPDRVYLSRAALSPLAIARDAEGNMYWASNPRWFRDIDAMFDYQIGFHTIELVQEGTLLTISTAADEAVVEDVRRFTPKCRPSDARLGDGIVWRGFDHADREADKAATRHEVVPRLPAWKPAKTAKPAALSAAVPAALAAGAMSSGWDYEDTLAEVSATSYPHSMSDQADLEEDDLWGAVADESDAEDEALSAMSRWLDEGGDPTVYDMMRAATMPSEIESLMSEYDLSTIKAFNRFKDLVNSVATNLLAKS